MENKDKILQWLLKLELYAKEQGIPMRILDVIEECKEHIQSEDMKWQELEPMLEQVLESICGKAGLNRVAAVEHGKNSVPAEKVKAQVKKMAEQCRKENLTSAAGIEGRKNFNIKECFRLMEDIAYTEAHLDQMLDGGLYLKFFENQKDMYERDSEEMIRELINDINGNYGRMAEQMRSMFQEIGGYEIGVGNEKFYREYVNGKEELENKLMGEVKTEDFGGSIIMEFAKKTKKGVQRIVKKLKPKKYVLMLFPVLLLMVIFVGKAVVQNYQTEISETEAESTEQGTNGFLEEMGKMMADKAMKDIDREGVNIITLVMKPEILLLIGFLILLVILLYALYIRMIKAWYRRCICRRCGDYLRTELGQFVKERTMHEKAQMAVEHILEEYERQYLGIWNRIFLGTIYEDRQEETELEVLQREWKTLKQS